MRAEAGLQLERIDVCSFLQRDKENLDGWMDMAQRVKLQAGGGIRR